MRGRRTLAAVVAVLAPVWVGTAAAQAPADDAAAAAMQQALETLVSGDSLSWRDPSSGAAGRITVVRTWKTAAGTFCRSFVEQRVDPPGAGTRASACRSRAGTWDRIAR